MRVLIVDDAPAARTILATLLADAGHDVAGVAENEPTALDACAALRPDAVIVDGRLEPAGALPLILRLRALDAELRIVVAASLDEVDLVRKAVAAGASAALERPFAPSKLEAALAAPARTR